MRKARLWALFAFGVVAFLPPALAIVDFHSLALPWLFGAWLLMIMVVFVITRPE